MGRDPQEILGDPAIREESRRIRRLQLLVRLTLTTIAEGQLSFKEASNMAAATRTAALNLFPGKETAFEVLYQPQLRRVLAWKYRLQ